jgi:preprotein translocase SecE subunit
MSILNTSNQSQLTSKIVNAFFFVATLLVAILYAKIFASFFLIFGIKDPAILGRDFTMSTMIALAMTIATLIYSLSATVASQFVNQVADELVKVTWPSMEESKLQTNNTIIVTAIIGFILFVFDWFFGGLTDFLLQG